MDFYSLAQRKRFVIAGNRNFNVIVFFLLAYIKRLIRYTAIQPIHMKETKNIAQTKTSWVDREKYYSRTSY